MRTSVLFQYALNQRISLEITDNCFISNPSRPPTNATIAPNTRFKYRRLRLLLHKALVKCCTTSDRSLSRMSTSDQEEDITPDLEELESEMEDERQKLSHILQKLSERK